MTTKAVSDGMMTIGAAAEAVGVATSVFRYYEDQGLAVHSL
ncbi:MAG: MerR family transcriptional regulator, partial [Planctomycetes bacterium]|nr:MerR family transcriptional regulator [Planctomycetota bacterium]